MAADYIFCAEKPVDFPLPGTLKVINYYDAWKQNHGQRKMFPIFDDKNIWMISIIKSQD